MSSSITLFKTGLSITSETHSHFINFDDLRISNLSEDSVNIETNPPLGKDLLVHGIIGLVPIGPGYLIFIDEKESVFKYEDIEINKVLKTIVVPVKYDLCKSLFNISNNEAKSDDASYLEGETIEIIDENENNKKKLVNQMKKHTDILFSKLGVYADDLKSSASLTLSNQKAQPSFKDEVEGPVAASQIDSEVGSTEDSRSQNNSDETSFKMKRSITIRKPSAVSKNSRSSHVKYKDISRSMLGKFEKQLTTFFDAKGFYYSDQLDLTRRVVFEDGKIVNETPEEAEANNHENQSGKAFWYNRHITKRLRKFDVPHKKLIQGFVNSIETTLEIKHTPSVKTAQVLLISKRSIKRAGLRYLRRGIDDNSNVANFVHTSQTLIMKDYELLRDTPIGLFCKFDIIRGSIPLFFNQDPSSLKPIPFLTKSLDNPDTPKAFNEHFQRLRDSYGDVSCISLVERSKRESEIGESFVKMCEDNEVDISWFDFHKVCSGMKFENVSKILDTKFDGGGYTVEQQLLMNGYFDSLKKQNQSGVFRVNCIDCLDRTNLVAKFLSEYLLFNVIFVKYNLIPVNKNKFQIDFNNLWADNGDSISRQYASTNALKGDYTRTSKRNYKGLMQDAWLSMSRYYSGYISDYFKQCVIEYLVGVKGKEVFLEFERSFDVKDSGVDHEGLEETKKRAKIIDELKLNDTGISHAVLVGIWHGFESSMKLNELRLLNRAEVKLNGDVWFVLTNKAIYFLTFTKDGEEFKDLIKIDKDDLKSLHYGVYFKNGGKGLHIDSFDKKSERNIGLKFILKKKLEIDQTDENNDENATTLQEHQEKDNTAHVEEDFLAFKFPQDMEYSNIKHIINLISKTFMSSGCLLEAHDILTLKDAAKLNTFNDFVDGIEYKFKKMIWG